MGGGALPGRLRTAELAAALSIATDLDSGQPLEHALRTCVLSVRLAELAGLDEQVAADAYYVALLHASGCTSDAHDAALLYGDDIAPRADWAVRDAGKPTDVVAFLARNVGRGEPAPRRAAALAGALAAGRKHASDTFAMHCEVAQHIAGRLGCASGVENALGFVFERWDGKGFPGDTGGEALPQAVRVLHLCRDACVFDAAAGREAATDVVRRRARTAYDPSLADVLCRNATALLGGLGEASVEAALTAEPGGQETLEGERLDDALAAVGDFADLKAPWFAGHARSVAGLAEAAAWRLRLGADDARLAAQAALLADLGRVGVSTAVWEKPRALSYAEWERVRLHPYHTERALSPVSALSRVSTVAAAHHERLDGSGYHRRLPATLLDGPARVLAAADAFQAMREPRPHRPALDEDEAAGELRRQVRGGRLDGEAVSAVLAAAGVAAENRAPARPAGLTEREVEVLQLLARGCSNREIGEALHVSPKTVGHHVQHAYGKAGVRSRAAATLFVVEHGLLRP